MKRHKSVTMTFSSQAFEDSIAHLHETLELESMVIAFFRYSESPNRLKLLVSEVRIPKDSDYLRRTPTFVSLTPEFLEECFQHCEANRCHFLDIHTHPWSTKPNFSSIDDGAARNTKIPYLREYVPGTEVAFALFGNTPEAVRARLWDSKIEKYRSIDKLVIV